MMSRQCHFGGGLSNKKAYLYYCVGFKNTDSKTQNYTTRFHSQGAPKVESHHRVHSPDTGRNSGGRQKIKDKKIPLSLATFAKITFEFATMFSPSVFTIVIFYKLDHFIK